MVAIGLLAIGLASVCSRVVGFTFVPLSTRLHPAPCRRSIDSRSSGVTTRSVQEPEHHRRPRRNRVSPSGGEYDVSKEQGSGRDRGSSALTETKSRAAHESELFDWLAENSGVDKKVSLNCFQDEGHRGLAVNQDVEYGEVLLEVPSEACLWSTRDGVISGLYGQTDMCWEAAGDLREPVSDDQFARGLTWDVRLAVALMEATADLQIGGKFWSLYGRLLPPPHTITVPFCLPERLLTQLHNEGMAARARKQIERLSSLFPVLMQTLLSHPQTAVYAKKQGEPTTKDNDAAPMALTWAFAMVRSRAFAANDNLFAFVPFLDMANHDFAPSANFTYEDPGVFRMRAMRDMTNGEEATISYGQQLDAEQLMVQYGFPEPSNVNLARPLMDPRLFRDRTTSAQESAPPAGQEVTPTDKGQAVIGSRGEENAEGEDFDGADDLGEVQRRALMDDLFLQAQRQFAREADGNDSDFAKMVRRALPLIPPMATAMQELRGEESAAEESARAFLAELQAYRSANFPTTEEQDKELLSYCLSEGRGKVDERLVDVVRYRIGRKEAHTLAVDIVEAFLAPPPPSDIPMQADSDEEMETGGAPTVTSVGENGRAFGDGSRYP